MDAIHAMAEQEGFTKKTGLYKKIYFGGLGSAIKRSSMILSTEHSIIQKHEEGWENVPGGVGSEGEARG